MHSPVCPVTHQHQSLHIHFLTHERRTQTCLTFTAHYSRLKCDLRSFFLIHPVYLEGRKLFGINPVIFTENPMWLHRLYCSERRIANLLNKIYQPFPTLWIILCTGSGYYSMYFIRHCWFLNCSEQRAVWIGRGGGWGMLVGGGGAGRGHSNITFDPSLTVSWLQIASHTTHSWVQTIVFFGPKWHSLRSCHFGAHPFQCPS